MEKFKFGWVRDLPDHRDFSLNNTFSSKTSQFSDLLKKLNIDLPSAKNTRSVLPASVDLRSFCSPIEDQGNLGSCTAHAAIGLLEYFQRKTNKRHIDGSRLFLYKTTRNLMGVTGDTGAYLRSTMGALTLFGAPPESYYPYDITKFDEEPSAFHYSFAHNFQALSYYRLDPPGISGSNLLTQIKICLSKGLPSMFGFSVFSSYTQSGINGGQFPVPTQNESLVGGHAVVAIGYNDTIKVTNTNPGGPTATGALLIRNSWGSSWGQAGYGWLPYQYVLSGLTSDWWSLLNAEWVDSDQFS